MILIQIILLQVLDDIRDYIKRGPKVSSGQAAIANLLWERHCQKLHPLCQADE